MININNNLIFIAHKKTLMHIMFTIKPRNVFPPAIIRRGSVFIIIPRIVPPSLLTTEILGRGWHQLRPSLRHALADSLDNA